MKISPLSVLLASTFLSTNAFAETPVVNIDYLNSLTSPNITWYESNEFNYDAMIINGKKYFYEYNNTNNYTQGQPIELYYEDGDISNVYFKGTYGYAMIDNWSSIAHDITADAINNNALFINNPYYGHRIGDVKGDIIGNGNWNGYTTIEAGAIYNAGSIKSIQGNLFAKNMAYATRYAYGGFLYNNYDENTPESLSLTPMEHDPDNFAVVGSIKGDIISNIAIAGREAYGGAIYNNEGKINSITANLIANNYALYMDVPEENSLNVTPANAGVNTEIPELYFNSGDAYGGFLYNRGYGVIENITATAFLNNSARAGSAHGGAIYNDAKIGKISGDFIGNNVLSQASRANLYGGAIYNNGLIDSIGGNFDGNYVFLDYDQRLEAESLYTVITPKTLSESFAIGGAIYNQGEIGNIKGNFSNNYVSTLYMGHLTYAYGGAIANEGYIESIVGDFVKNSISAETWSPVAGGAIFNNYGEIGYISGNFLNNYAKNYDNDGLALGGAIFNYYSDLNFVADGKAYKISGNYTKDSRGKINNAIWMQEDWHYGVARPSVGIDSINISTKSNKLPQFLTFNVTNKGSYTIDDIIDGGYANGDYIEYEGYGYNLLVTGDACPECEYNSVRFNSTVNNVLNFGIEKAQVALGKNAKVFVTNNYYAMNNPWLRVDVDASAETSGKLYIDGDVYGTTQVIANIINYKDIGEILPKPMVMSMTKTATMPKQAKLSQFTEQSAVLINGM